MARRFIFIGKITLLLQQYYFRLSSWTCISTIVTGKVGFGIGDIDFATIIGVRAYPPTAYIQFSNNQRFNFSAEYLLDEDIFGQSLIITYGIRFY